jgi:hypothetical protein
MPNRSRSTARIRAGIPGISGPLLLRAGIFMLDSGIHVGLSVFHLGRNGHGAARRHWMSRYGSARKNDARRHQTEFLQTMTG